MAASSGSGGISSDPPAQATPKRSSEGLSGDVAGAREAKYRSPLPSRDLGNDVSGGAEAVKTESLAVAGQRQRSPADQPGAQQRGQRNVAAELSQWKGEARVGDRRRREAPITGISGEDWVVA